MSLSPYMRTAVTVFNPGQTHMGGEVPEDIRQTMFDSSEALRTSTLLALTTLTDMARGYMRIAKAERNAISTLYPANSTAPEDINERRGLYTDYDNYYREIREGLSSIKEAMWARNLITSEQAHAFEEFIKPPRQRSNSSGNGYGR